MRASLPHRKPKTKPDPGEGPLRRRHGKIKLDWTIHDFYYALARLGGHQNRKGDHPPGWQTIWEGWKEIQAMVAGVEAMKELKRCG
jgi:hypothetical protein